MKRQWLWLAFLSLLIMGNAVAMLAQQRQAQATQRQPRAARTELVFLTGRVAEIHAPRLFTVRPSGDEREVLVLSPRGLSPEFAGATVNVEGIRGRFTEAELERTAGWGELDDKTRARFRGRPVLVATSLMAMVGGEMVARVRGTAPASLEQSALGALGPRVEAAPAARVLQPASGQRPPRPLAIRATMLADNIDEFAGHPLRVLHGRVVGVFDPHAFLIEPATTYMKAMGRRDRMLVLLESGSLRAPAELIVGSIVNVTGTARTLVGVQMTREVAWPEQLRPEVVRRLEVRGALLATSVQSGDGVELTDRSPAPAGR